MNKYSNNLCRSNYKALNLLNNFNNSYNNCNKQTIIRIMLLQQRTPLLRAQLHNSNRINY